MWCGTCQSEIVTEVASDHRRVSCSICGATLGETAASHEDADKSVPPAGRTTQARDLLDRWAKTPLFDPFAPGQKQSGPIDTAGNQAAEPQTAAASPPPAAGPLPNPPTSPPDGSPTEPATTQELDRLTEEILSRVAVITSTIGHPSAPDAARTETLSDSTESASKWRIDPGIEDLPEPVLQVEGETGGGPHTAETDSWMSDRSAAADMALLYGDVNASENPVIAPSTPALDKSSTAVRIEPAQFADSIPPPHTEFSQTAPAARPGLSQKSGFFGNLGQALAYLGILGLTAGTSLVVVGYFGGPAHYAPTGWLITTIGQMMLFLGVVTLVSTGIEQTQADVRESLRENYHEVSARIDQLSQRLTHINTVARETTDTQHTLLQPAIDAEVSESNPA